MGIWENGKDEVSDFILTGHLLAKDSGRITCPLPAVPTAHCELPAPWGRSSGLLGPGGAQCVPVWVLCLLTWKCQLPWLFFCTPDLTAFDPGTQAGGGGLATTELEWNPNNLYPS